MDGTAVIESFNDGELVVRVPMALDRYLVYKGSIAIDGISLTIADVREGLVRVAIIPHTLAVTNLGMRCAGDRVNVECDMLAKHVEKLMGHIVVAAG